MFILVDQAHVVQYKLTVLEETVDPSGLDVYKISENLFCSKRGIQAFNVPTGSEDIEPYKYCYTVEKGFYPNPNWKEPLKPVEVQLEELRLAKAESELEIDERISKLELGLA